MSRVGFVGDYGGWPVVDGRLDVTGPVLWSPVDLWLWVWRENRLTACKTQTGDGTKRRWTLRTPSTHSQSMGTFKTGWNSNSHDAYTPEKALTEHVHEYARSNLKVGQFQIESSK